MLSSLFQVRVLGLRLQCHQRPKPRQLQLLQPAGLQLHLLPAPLQPLLPQRDRPQPHQRLRQRQLHRGRAQLQRVLAEVQDGLWPERPGGLLEEPGLHAERVEEGGGVQDHDHPELTEVLPPGVVSQAPPSPLVVPLSSS